MQDVHSFILLLPQYGYTLQLITTTSATTMKSFLTYYITFFILCLSAEYSIAQHHKPNNERHHSSLPNCATISDFQSTECSGLSIPDYNKQPLLLNIKNLGKKSLFSPEIELLKLKKTQNKLKDYQTVNHVQDNILASSSELTLATNFQGNIFNGGAPPDNTIAIADNGSMVSVINCNVAYYNSAGKQLWTGSFWELFNDPSLTEIIYDPIVVYDSQADRFIMVVIHGTTSLKSKLIISVSKSNNPLDGWWTYKLSGNPLNNSCWLDYPKLGISNNEIFVTGSLFSDLSGFSESIIFQISKSNALIGKNLTWKLWSDIAGSPITIIPASYGRRGNYGPGLYFVTQSPTTGNSVNLYEITNDLSANPQLTRTTIFKSEYEPSGFALQLGSSVQLITGDCKILNAFYLNGIIHYVFQSDYQSSNYTGINYNQINVTSGTHRTFTYGQLGFDCAYPSVASYATSDSDKSVVFCYLRSGATIYPETRAIMLDSNGIWSNSILIKRGDTYVDAFEVDNFVRWGDYSGITYKFNPAQPEVWISGCYGSTQTLFSTKYNCFNTWIGQIKGAILNTVEQSNESQPELTVYPNPIIDLFSIDFHVEQSTTIHIEIHDVSGMSGSTLFNGQLKKGKNLLTFNRAAFSKGVYYLTIKGQDKILASKKLFIE